MRRLVLPCLVIGVLSGVALARFADVPQLLYPSNRSGNNEICLLNADGSASKNLTESKASNTDPAWSPDGTKIAFVSDRNGTRDIYLMDADGKNVKQLTTDKGENRGPAWSPDGKMIARNTVNDGKDEERILRSQAFPERIDKLRNAGRNGPGVPSDPFGGPGGKS